MEEERKLKLRKNVNQYYKLKKQIEYTTLLKMFKQKQKHELEQFIKDLELKKQKDYDLFLEIVRTSAHSYHFIETKTDNSNMMSPIPCFMCNTDICSGCACICEHCKKNKKKIGGSYGLCDICCPTYEM